MHAIGSYFSNINRAANVLFVGGKIKRQFHNSLEHGNDHISPPILFDRVFGQKAEKPPLSSFARASQELLSNIGYSEWLHESNWEVQRFSSESVRQTSRLSDNVDEIGSGFIGFESRENGGFYYRLGDIFGAYYSSEGIPVVQCSDLVAPLRGDGLNAIIPNTNPIRHINCHLEGVPSELWVSTAFMPHAATGGEYDLILKSHDLTCVVPILTALFPPTLGGNNYLVIRPSHQDKRPILILSGYSDSNQEHSRKQTVPQVGLLLSDNMNAQIQIGRYGGWPSLSGRLNSKGCPTLVAPGAPL